MNNSNQKRIAEEEKYHEEVREYIMDKSNTIQQPSAPKTMTQWKKPVKKSLAQLLREGRERRENENDNQSLLENKKLELGKKNVQIITKKQPESEKKETQIRGILYGTGLTKKVAERAEKGIKKKLTLPSQRKLKTPEQELKEIEEKQNEQLLKEQRDVQKVEAPIKDSYFQKLSEPLEPSEPEITLDEYQERALEGIMKEKYAVLIGAAGTGKTTLEKIIVSELEKQFAKIDINLMKKRDENSIYDNIEQEPEWRAPICFCAFTGRAVQMMKRVLPLEYHSLCNTIHATLGYYPEFYEEKDYKTGMFKRKMKFVPYYTAERKLPYKVFIIDEAGTCPIYLWNQLYDAMEDDARVILVGDINQIPPVQGRSVLGFAMVNWPTFALEKIHRQAEGNPIIENAHKILNGQFPEKHSGVFDIVKLPPGSVETKQAIIGYTKQMHQKDIFHPFRDSLIVAQNEGGFGQKDLNEILAPYFNNGAERHVIRTGNGLALYAEGDKVMLLANDRQRGLTNGMTGKIISINLNGAYKGTDYHKTQVSKHVEIDLDDFAKSIEEEINEKNRIKQPDETEADDLEKNQRQSSHVTTVEFPGDKIIDFQTAGDYRLLSLGYAMTCHKMQGGECPTIAIAIHSANDRVLSREWLYTAVTRGQERVVLMCNDRALLKALKRQKIKGKTLQEKIDVFVKLEDQSDTTVPNLPEKERI